MNSLLNLTAKLQRLFLIAALVACPLLVGNGNAQVVTATLLNNGSSTVNITGNQTFTLTLSINTNFISSGITYFLTSSTGGLFRITARDISTFANPGCTTCVSNGFGSPYPDLTADDASAFTIPAGDLNPTNDFDLGSTNNGSATDPAGGYTIAILTFQALNAPAGQYTIFTSQGVVTDRTGGAFNDVNFSALATINVAVPEPATIGLAIIGGGMLLVVARRKRAARA